MYRFVDKAKDAKGARKPSGTTTQGANPHSTWLVFQNSTWVPLDHENQMKLEQTLHLGGTFVDIRDSHFPGVNRVRIFPKSNYLSYLGLKYRLSQVLQPAADLMEGPRDDPSPPPALQPILDLPGKFVYPSSSSTLVSMN
ncbi:hypothetical protein BC940DRAFT_322365 [Gongronella butleri]|nr:hypothetical protein BC940DRAFT_322365 [Gongronella butleri]